MPSSDPYDSASTDEQSRYEQARHILGLPPSTLTDDPLDPANINEGVPVPRMYVAGDIRRASESIVGLAYPEGTFVYTDSEEQDGKTQSEPSSSIDPTALRWIADLRTDALHASHRIWLEGHRGNRFTTDNVLADARRIVDFLLGDDLPTEDLSVDDQVVTTYPVKDNPQA